MFRYLWKHIKQFFTGYKEPRQTTFCWCDKCDNELISSESYVEDDGELSIFICKECGSKSEWLFSAPAPILIRVDGEVYEHTREGIR